MPLFLTFGFIVSDLFICFKSIMEFCAMQDLCFTCRTQVSRAELTSHVQWPNVSPKRNQSIKTLFSVIAAWSNYKWLKNQCDISWVRKEIYSMSPFRGSCCKILICFFFLNLAFREKISEMADSKYWVFQNCQFSIFLAKISGIGPCFRSTGITGPFSRTL